MIAYIMPIKLGLNAVQKLKKSWVQNEEEFYTIAPAKKKFYSLSNFSASGIKVPPMIIFHISWATAESFPSNYFIGRGDTGWMVPPTFYECIPNFFYP